jgi:hypothetical protein
MVALGATEIRMLTLLRQYTQSSIRSTLNAFTIGGVSGAGYLRLFGLGSRCGPSARCTPNISQSLLKLRYVRLPNQVNRTCILAETRLICGERYATYSSNLLWKSASHAHNNALRIAIRMQSD